MFNDILMGKAPIDMPPPVRATIDMTAVADCVSCQVSYPAYKGVNGECTRCAFDSRQTALAESSRAVAAMAENQRRIDRNAMIVKVGLGILITIGLAAFKFGMRQQFRADMNEANGIKSYEQPYVYQSNQ